MSTVSYTPVETGATEYEDGGISVNNTEYGRSGYASVDVPFLTAHGVVDHGS